jgi:hypothetical protein
MEGFLYLSQEGRSRVGPVLYVFSLLGSDQHDDGAFPSNFFLSMSKSYHIVEEIQGLTRPILKIYGKVKISIKKARLCKEIGKNLADS